MFAKDSGSSRAIFPVSSDVRMVYTCAAYTFAAPSSAPAAMIPVHPKDLWPRKVPDSYQEGLDTASVQTDASTALDANRAMLTAWIASLRSFSDEAQSDMLQRFQNRWSIHTFKKVHVIPLQRSDTIYKALFLRREQCKPGDSLRGMTIDGPGNTFLLDMRLSLFWINRELFFMPYPNAGWVAPGKARPMNERMREAPIVMRTSGPGPWPYVGVSTYLEMPPAVHLELRCRTQSAYDHAHDDTSIPVPRPALGNLPEALGRHIRVPAAAFLYASMAQLGSQLISDELRAEIARILRSILGSSPDLMV